MGNSNDATVSNRFSRVLTAHAKERPVLDAAVSSTEALVDILMKDELIAAVPVFSTAFKALKALDSMRDRLFAAKLQAFIAEAETMNEDEREEVARKLTADDEGKKAAETLLMVLDKMTDMDKPALLGVLLKHFGSGRIFAPDLRRLAVMVDASFADDLAAFLAEPYGMLRETSTAQHREALVSSGITRVLTGDTIKNIGQVYFGVSPWGILLHQLASE